MEEYKLNKFITENAVLNTKNHREIMFVMEREEKISMIEKINFHMYKKSILKSKNIDYKDIEASKGDFRRYKHSKLIADTILLVNRQTNNTNINIDDIKIISNTIDILIKESSHFRQGFSKDRHLIKFMYNNLVMGIISSLSLFISTRVNVVGKVHGGYASVVVEKNNKKLEYTMIRNLKEFNDSYYKGELTKIFKDIDSVEYGLLGTGSVLTGSIFLMIAIIPILREMIYQFYNIRTSLADMIDTLSTNIELNHTIIENNDKIDKSKKKSIISKQTRLKQKLEKLSQKIEVDFSNVEVSTKKDLKNDAKDFDTLASSTEDINLDNTSNDTNINF